MGFTDLRYGWRSEEYVLSDVDIRSSIELQQPDKDGAWSRREPFMLGVFAKTEEEREKEITDFETINEVVYSKPSRVLYAKAGFSDNTYRAMFLGVPEDKQTTNNTESRVEHFDLSIHEITEQATDDLVKIVKAGEFGCIEASSELNLSASLFAQFYVPTQVFDDIEHQASQPGVEFAVSINRKGWYWLGPVGDSQAYFDTEELEMAELAGITIKKNYKNWI